MSGQRLADEHYFADPANTRWIYGRPAIEPETVTEFVAVIAPLEARAGKRLGEPARTRCLLAFAEEPVGVRRLAEDALARGRQNPLGLFIRMVEADEFRAPEPIGGQE